MIPVITLDGPSGVGKGTLSKMLAEALGWHYLDSGALYRVLAFAAQKHHVSVSDEIRLVTLSEHLDVSFQKSQIIFEGQDVTDLIRVDVIGQLASKISTLPLVRKALLARQRAFRKAPGLVTDGRDMGSVVFPNANLKIFLTASLEERARRRHHQLQGMGIAGTLEDLVQDMHERDQRDQERAVAPLKKEPDAIELNTDYLQISEAFARVYELACWVGR